MDKRTRFSRRELLQSGLALGALSCIPRAAQAQSAGFRALIVIEQSGGVDNFLYSIPLGNAHRNALRSRRSDITGYYDTPGSLVEVGSGIAMHPNLAPLIPYLSKTRVTMGCVNNLNLPANGSHEIAQIRMALGTEIRSGQPAGWMAKMFDAGVDVVGFTGTRPQHYACQSARCRETPPLVVDSLEAYRMDGVAFSGAQGGGATSQHVAATLELMAGLQQPEEGTLRSNYRAAQQAMIQSADAVQDTLSTYQSPLHQLYPAASSQYAKHLRNVATLITKMAQQGSQERVVFSVPLGSFDSHHNFNGSTGWLMAEFAQNTRILLDDLSALGVLQNVVLMTSTEFGRQIASSGNGTHHGDSFTSLTIGGNIRGGVGGVMLSPTILSTAYDWPRSVDSIDSRSLLAEIIERHMGLNPAQTAFPGAIYSEFSRPNLGLFL